MRYLYPRRPASKSIAFGPMLYLFSCAYVTGGFDSVRQALLLYYFLLPVSNELMQFIFF